MRGACLLQGLESIHSLDLVVRKHQVLELVALAYLPAGRSRGGSGPGKKGTTGQRTDYSRERRDAVVRDVEPSEEWKGLEAIHGG